MKKEILAYAITHAPKGVKGGPYEAIGGDMGDTCARLSASLRWPVDNPVNTPEEVLAEAREFLAEEIAPKVPHARVIRIVRKARPSESSAVEAAKADADRKDWERAEALLAASPSHRVILGPGLRQMSYRADAIADLLEAMPDDQLPAAEPGEVARTKAALLRGVDLAKARPAPSEADAVEVLRELVAWDDAPSEGQLEPTIHRARRVIAASGPDPMPVVRAAMTYWGSGGTMSDGPLLRAVDAYRKAGGK